MTESIEEIDAEIRRLKKRLAELQARNEKEKQLYETGRDVLKQSVINQTAKVGRPARDAVKVAMTPLEKVYQHMDAIGSIIKQAEKDAKARKRKRKVNFA